MSRHVVMVIRLKPECRDAYLKLHRAPDSVVMQALRDMHHRDYRIHLLGDLLVASFTYTGDDLEGDRALLRARPELQEWMQLTAAMQEQFEVTQEGQWWSVMEEVLHSE